MAKMLDQLRYVCALGAMQTVQGIYRGVPVLHSGPGCAQKLSQGIAGSNGDSGYISPQIYPCTNVSEKETVFGGEDKLRETIENALKVVDGDLYVVLSGCTTEIIGDDIGKVVRDIPSQGKPLVYVETAGFKGTNLEGHEWVLRAIIEQHLAQLPKKDVVKGLVNIWGPVPSYDPFWVGSIREIENLVRELGLTPNSIFGEFRGIDNVNLVPRAEFNLLLSPWLGLSTVQLLEQTFGTPYLHIPVLPIGAFETSRFLKAVGEKAGLDPAKVAAVVDRHEKEYYYHIERTSDVFLENRSMSRRFSVVSGATDVLSISRFLVNDYGLIPAKQYITDNTPEEHRERVAGYFKDYEYGIRAEVEFSTDGFAIHEQIRQEDYFGAPLLIGSIWEKKLAQELSGNFLAVSAPIKERLVLSTSYAGYDGGLRLLEDIWGYVLKAFN